MKVQSQIADINTPTGVMRCYIHQPADSVTSNKKYPAILFYSEIFQQTDPIERAATIIASHGYVAVSYTHLDVYKRQPKQQLNFSLIDTARLYAYHYPTPIKYRIADLCLLYTSRCV